MDKPKIIIAGIGAVGGYFGGLLANHFSKSTRASVYFVARGENLKQIRLQGLKVIKGQTEFIAMPELATDNPSEIGIADYIIISTKSYDLETMINQLKPCIDKQTIILPLLNGVDSKEKIKGILPDNLVLDGCVYIVSRLTQPGIIENKGNLQKLYFGSETNESNGKLEMLEKLMKEAGVEATLSTNISSVIWEKFIFISPSASATSYFNEPFGVILSDPDKLNTMKLLIEEIKTIALAKNITIAEDVTEKTLKIQRALPYETTSSMHTDLLNDKPVTELESLVGYVVREGRNYRLSIPTYERVYKSLKERAGLKPSSSPKK